MANKFEVRVVALDQFTKTFRDLNNQASKAVRPLVNVHRQVGMLAREMHLDKMAKGMGVVSNEALTMTRALGLSLGPLQNVLGVAGGAGIVGMLGAAAVGAVKMGVNFAGAGFEISRTSQALGVSTQFLQRMRGAAKLAGVEVDTIDGAVRGLGDTLQNAQFGRDPTAYAILNRLGIGIPMKNGHVDTEAALGGIERALSKIQDAQTRNTLADALHIPRESIPLLMQGADAVKALGDRAEKAGLVQGPAILKWGQDFTNQMNDLKGALEGVGNQFASSFGPAATSSLQRITKDINESKGHRVSAAAHGAWDFLTFFPRLLGDWISAPNRTDKQSVGGAIGGALHAGAYVPGEPASGPARAALPVGLRNNNPGNLRSWGGVPSVGGFASFATPEAGLAAMAAQLGLYGARGNDTLAGIIGAWAPPSENNTPAYLADVAKRTGFDPGAHLNLGDPSVLSPLMQAMVQHEQGRQPFTADQYAAAAGGQKVAIDLHVHGLPAGASVTAQPRAAGGDAFTPTRIGYSMATAEMP